MNGVRVYYRRKNSQLEAEITYFDQYTLILIPRDTLKLGFPIERAIDWICCEYGIGIERTIILSQITKLPESWEIILFGGKNEDNALRYPVWQGVTCSNALLIRKGLIGNPSDFFAYKKSLTREIASQATKKYSLSH